MKKIRFIKDIPELEVMADRASRFEVCFTCSRTSSGRYKYDSDTYSFMSSCSAEFLVEHGYAEGVEERDWKEWVTNKEFRFWATMRNKDVHVIKKERDNLFVKFANCDLWSSIPDWQARLMYQWILQEYANEKNKDWKPDWTSYNLKYYIFYNGIDSRWELTWSEHTFGINIVYFKNKEDVRQCIEDIGELVLDKLKDD